MEDEAAAVLRAIGASARAAGGSRALQRLIDATHALMEHLEQDVVVRAGFELGSGPPRRDGVADLRGQWQGWVEEVLKDAEREGILAPGVSAADAAVTVVAATVGIEQRAAKPVPGIFLAGCTSLGLPSHEVACVGNKYTPGAVGAHHAGLHACWLDRASTNSDALSDLGLWLGELAVFDATVAAVPFLWDLAVADAVTCRPEVIELLQAILEHGNAPQIEVQHAAHLAVLGGASTVEVLTRDGDPAVRAAASELAAVIDSHVCDCCRPV